MTSSIQRRCRWRCLWRSSSPRVHSLVTPEASSRSHCSDTKEVEYRESELGPTRIARSTRIPQSTSSLSLSPPSTPLPSLLVGTTRRPRHRRSSHSDRKSPPSMTEEAMCGSTYRSTPST
ncbi:hypothetical protein U1Q18_039396 [Sarracenia purpurea var. burkii]